jgi:hypothetical protein
VGRTPVVVVTHGIRIPRISRHVADLVEAHSD